MKCILIFTFFPGSFYCVILLFGVYKRSMTNLEKVENSFSFIDIYQVSVWQSQVKQCLSISEASCTSLDRY